MKKHFLLTLAAVPFFCIASVNAQSIQPDFDLSEAKTFQVCSENNSAQPDSLLIEKNGIINSKYFYKYDDSGRMIEQILWTNTPSTTKYAYTYAETGKDYVIDIAFLKNNNWMPVSKQSVKFDKHGRQILLDIATVKGYTPKQHKIVRTEYKDNNILISTKDTIWNDNSEQKYTKSESLVTQTLDKNGNIISEKYTVIPNNFASQEIQMEYNDLNQMIKKTTISYVQENKEYARYRENWTFEENTNNAYELMEVSQDGGTTWKFYAEYKAETSGNNPVIVTRSTNMHSKEEPVWVTEKLTYFYPNSVTANENIENEAEVRIYTQQGAVVVNSEKAETVAVYSITGKCCYNATVSGMTTINNLPTGIYIVKAGNNTMKLWVR